MPKRSRDKQLAKLAARRQAERDAAKRRRNLVVGAIAAAIVLVASVVAAGKILSGDDPAAAAATPSVSSPSPSASPVNPAPCSSDRPAAADQPKPSFKEPAPDTIDPDANYTATIDTSCGTIEVELLAETATDSVNSFAFLADQGFYDGTIWHRIVAGFVIQGGDPQGTGLGGPGYELPVTVTKGSSFDAEGDLAFAHSATGGNGSQFFITLDPAPNLDPPDGKYTIFGHVTKGMKVVETIGSVPVGGEGGETPVQPVYINSITINES